MFTNEMSVFWSKSLTKSLLIPGLLSFLQLCTASPEILQMNSWARPQGTIYYINLGYVHH